MYAMKVTEILSFYEYSRDERFFCKKPNLRGSRKQARGDNIYYKRGNKWQQRNSFHSNKDGCPNRDHIKRDTKIDKILISDKYVYFGAHGPKIPGTLKIHGKPLCHKGRMHRRFSLDSDNDRKLVTNFLKRLNPLNKCGFAGNPFDWNDTITTG